jgi:hypothetical protein
MSLEKLIELKWNEFTSESSKNKPICWIPHENGNFLFFFLGKLTFRYKVTLLQYTLLEYSFWLVEFLTNKSSEGKSDLGFEFLDIDNLQQSFIRTLKVRKIEKLVSNWSSSWPMKAQRKNSTSDSNCWTSITYSKVLSEHRKDEK